MRFQLNIFRSANSARMPLQRWIWKAYSRTALIPILLVELALLTAYIGTNHWSREQNVQLHRDESKEALLRIAGQVGATVTRQLEGVEQQVKVFSDQVTVALGSPAVSGVEPTNRYRFSKEGIYYSPSDDGAAAVFYSGIKPIGPKEKDKVNRLAKVDSLMRSFKEANPLIVQSYFNSYDSLNRIYPFFDVLSQYPPKMDIPTYNFYYEADASHNPGKRPVWTDVYLDPAGKGWMASVIAPVYRGEFLEGVVGMDITVDTIVQTVLNLHVPWKGYAVLVGRQGSLLAMPPLGESDFGLSELSKHVYEAPVSHDTFKPESYNIFKHHSFDSLGKRIQEAAQGIGETNLQDGRLVAWHRIESTGWTLLIIASPNQIFEKTLALSHKLWTMGLWMISALILFYMVFFFGLYIRARQASQFIGYPLQVIEGMVRRIGAREYEQPIPNFSVSELQETAIQIRASGLELGRLHESLTRAQTQLDQKNRWLIAIFQLSPDGLVIFDESGRFLYGNPAFFKLTGFFDWSVQRWCADEFWEELGKLTARTEMSLCPPVDDTELTLDLIRPCPRNLHCYIRSTAGSRQGASEPKSTILYFRDMTQSRELDRMKSEFLMTAAHELRTPLTSVMGYAELLIKGGFEQSIQQEMLEAILAQSNGLVRILGDLLDISRMESRAGVDFHIVRQEVNPILRQCILAEIPEDSQRQVDLEIAEEAQGLELPIDSYKIAQALSQLLNNACKFSPEDSPIVIRVLVRERRLGISISDKGIGMSEHARNHIFDRFFRADTSGLIPGTGLGMSIVKEIVKIHHGDVQVQSEVGQGTTVTIWLPL